MLIITICKKNPKTLNHIFKYLQYEMHNFFTNVIKQKIT